jgi:hypothetical protein
VARAGSALLLLAAVWASACARPDSRTDAAGAGAASAGATAAARDEPRADTLKAICASEFGQGDFASVSVFRNASDAVAVLALRPDINRFTHAPHTYYGPDGASLLVVPERPVTPEQRATDPVLRRQAELLQGLVERESAFCRDHR